MGGALRRGVKASMCYTMIAARNRLLGCRAFMVVKTKTTLGLAKNNMNSRSLFSTTSPQLSAPREAVGLTSRLFVQNREVHVFSGGAAAGESSPPPPEWNLPVPVDEYVALGPRYRQQLRQPEDWLADAADLAASLGIEPPTSTEAQHRRVFHLYLPVYSWLKDLLLVSRQQRAPSSSSPSPPDLADAPPATLELPCAESSISGFNNGTSDPPLVIGISAPQGCGKSTLVSEMQRMLEKAGHSCVVVSIDDFYLTGAEQVSSY